MVFLTRLSYWDWQIETPIFCRFVMVHLGLHAPKNRILTSPKPPPPYVAALQISKVLQRWKTYVTNLDKQNAKNYQTIHAIVKIWWSNKLNFKKRTRHFQPLGDLVLSNASIGNCPLRPPNLWQRQSPYMRLRARWALAWSSTLASKLPIVYYVLICRQT